MASTRIVKRGDRYQARVEWYDDNGTRRTRSKNFALRRDAISWVAATEPSNGHDDTESNRRLGYRCRSID